MRKRTDVAAGWRGLDGIVVNKGERRLAVFRSLLRIGRLTDFLNLFRFTVVSRLGNILVGIVDGACGR